MSYNRDRSRSRGRGGGSWKDDKKEGVAEAAKSGSSEQEIVSVAIRQLPGEIRERLEKLFEEGLLKEGDLDLRSITVFASLNEGLQARVMNHMESERIYVANARSKSGFMIATCDKAKTGCLDARGLGAIDPWRTALVAMATPKQRQIELKTERDWLDEHEDKDNIKIHVDVSSVESELGVPSVTVELPLTESSSAIKAKLVAMGIRSLPPNRMKFHTESVGFLKDRHSFAFFNFADGVTIALSERKRAGNRFRKDHTVMPKRPKTQPAPGEAPSPVDALKTLAAAKPGGLPTLPGLPGLPKLPGMPGLPGLGTLPGLGGTLPGLGATGLAGLPGLAKGGLPGMPGLPGLPGLPGMPGLAGKAPGLPDIGGLLGKAGSPIGMSMPAGLPPGMSMPGSGNDPMLAMKAALDKMKAAGAPPALPTSLMGENAGATSKAAMP